MLSEQDVDRELKAALSVSPSPGFEARVLQRVEADRPSRWPAHYGWLAAAASVVVAAGVFYAMNRTVPAPAPRIVERTAPAAGVPPAAASVPANTSQPARVVPVHAASRAPRLAEPEGRPEPKVIVSVNQMEAVRRLVRAVNEGRVEVPAEPPPGPMAPPATLEVAPVGVAPIPLSPLGTETATPFIRDVK